MTAAAIEALAGELADVLLSGDPFAASFMSVPGHEDAVPDLSPEYQQAWRGRLVDVIARCAETEADPGIPRAASCWRPHGTPRPASWPWPNPGCSSSASRPFPSAARRWCS